MNFFWRLETNDGVYELDPNGAFPVPKYGTVKDERMFRVLRAYSPYYNVRNGERYPPTLLLTGENDDRVNPMHSRKMIAQLQAANSKRCTAAAQDQRQHRSRCGHTNFRSGRGAHRPVFLHHEIAGDSLSHALNATTERDYEKLQFYRIDATTGAESLIKLLRWSLS